MNKHPEAVSVVQQVHKILSNFENLSECTPDKVGESSKWTSIVNSGEDNSILLQNSMWENAF
jgi:hypothetical protein